jgi:hypothetical protein
VLARVILLVVSAAALATPQATAQPDESRSAAAAPALAVALLPLDARNDLTLYGQPVASELTRVLRAEHLDVLLVAASAPVPSRAMLVVDGKIRRDARGSIILEARVRDPQSGSDLARVTASTSSLSQIDRAAAELAAKLIPEIRSQLQAMAVRPVVARIEEPRVPPVRVESSRPQPRSTPPPALILLMVSTAEPLARRQAAEHALRQPLQDMIAELGGQAVHRPRHTDAVAWKRELAQLGGVGLLVVEALPVAWSSSQIPMIKMQARVQLFDRQGAVLFDRVVRTDTIVGGRGMNPLALLRQAGRQLVDIALPRLREVMVRGERPWSCRRLPAGCW